MADSSHREMVAALEERLGHQFSDGALVQEALTHASFANETGAGMPHNERLEFLGDAVLGMVVGHWLFVTHPDRPEGELTQMRSRLVKSTTLAALARELDLGTVMLIGVGEERTGGRGRRSLLADSLEAVLGAIYLDAGYETTERVIQYLLADRMSELEDGVTSDMKSKLQEWAQSSLRTTPVYRITGSSGPPHDTHFEAEVRVGSEIAARGAGTTKQGAEKDAAREALTTLGVEL
jgi:ribonuclease-3